jgi:hypothetical protein
MPHPSPGLDPAAAVAGVLELLVWNRTACNKTTAQQQLDGINMVCKHPNRSPYGQQYPIFQQLRTA